MSFAIIGAQGHGKTTSVKEILRKTPHRKFIFDVNREYTEFKNSASGILDPDEFTEKATTLNNSVIVFEEATIFFGKGSKNKNIRNLLVRKRHTNNLIIFVFHNVRSVPMEIMSLCDFLILHKTKDNKEYISRYFKDTPENLNHFLEVNRHPNHFFKKIIKNNA
jgi:hypothetical protein